jgi:hypothetical protein
MHPIRVAFILSLPIEFQIKISMNPDPSPQFTAETTFPKTELRPAAARRPSDFSTSRASDRHGLQKWLPETGYFKEVSSETRSETNLFDASMRALIHRKPDDSVPALKLVEFSLAKPDAKMVQLAADFTDWESSPIDMIRFDDGVWSTTVPLPAGIYAYRFLVDGHWHDDPRAIRRENTSAGIGKAVVLVK